jgi:SAM-dependent methyltransferase
MPTSSGDSHQSFDRPREERLPPSPWVTRFAALLPADGQVLDLAAGHGRHTRWLLEQGRRVLAADLDTSGLRDLAGHRQLEILEMDLEANPVPLPGRRFAGIVVTNYLHRPHFRWLASALEPGGVLIIETFGQGNERHGRPRNPDFLLAPGELLDAFAGRLHIVAYEHGLEMKPRPAVRQRLCALASREPDPEPWPLPAP